MTQSIQRHFVLGATVAAVAGFAVAAIAQPATGPGPGMMRNGGAGMTGGPAGMMSGFGNVSGYLDGLKSRLDITADEEPAWREYADAVSGVGQQMQGLHQTMFEAMGTASWEERRNLMNTMFQARQQAFDTVRDAAGKLLVALNPAQKERAQSILPGLGYGHRMMAPG